MKDALDFAARPNRLPWPPMILAAAVAGAVLAGRSVPRARIAHGVGPVRAAGAVALAAGAALDLAAVAAMRRHDTGVRPDRAASALVTTGPFARTRNPIYVGNTLALIGLGLLTRNPWFLAAAPVAAVAVDRLAIRREERHLAARFGEAWAAYARATPRWLI